MTDTTSDIDDRIVQALRDRDQIVLTATGLAETVGSHRTTVLDHLRELEGEGRVTSIELGASAVGWFLPGDWKNGTPEQYLIPTYHEYVRRPSDKRGRVTVGAEYAHKTLTYAILESPAIISVEPGEWNYKTPLAYQRAVEVDDAPADERGRIGIGRDWANTEVSLAVLEVRD